MKKVVAYFLVGTMMASTFSTLSISNVYAETQVTQTESQQSKEGNGAGVNVAYRTQEEIRAYAKEHPYEIYDNGNIMEEEASYEAPYNNPGKPTSSFIQDGLNAINQVRYAAGLGEVVLDNTYTKLAQMGSYLNALNYPGLSHTPNKPDGMDEEAYQLGYQGASNSNLGVGYYTLAQTVIDGWMNDGDDYNISNLGHRRWVLNPPMGKTGLGFVDPKGYSAMYAMDRSALSTSMTTLGVAWPAQNMPIEYVRGYSYISNLFQEEYEYDSNYPWSYSYGTVVDADKVEVTLTRERDQKQWKFSKQEADGAFYVDNQFYGQRGCIIFRPENVGEYYANDKFHVEITGLSKEVSYDVSFFSLDEAEEQKALDTFEVDVKNDVLYLDGEYNTTTEISGKYYNLYKGNIQIKSSDSSIFTVEGNKIIPKQAGIGYLEATISIGNQVKTIKKAIEVKQAGVVMEQYQTKINLGDTYTFKAVTQGITGDIEYSVSDESIANIDKTTGEFQALKEGNVVVTAVVGTSKAEITVSIVDPNKVPEILEMTKYKREMTVGSRYTFVATKQGISSAIRYSVSNTKIATINSKTGELKALKAGTVTVKAKAGTKEAKVTVTIKVAPKVSMTKYKREMTVGSRYTFVATKQGISSAIRYSVSNTKIATINSKTGKLKALKAGTVTVTAKAGTKEAKVTVRVKEVPKIKMTKYKSTMKVGSRYTFVATKQGVSSAIRYSVSNKKIATINSKTGQLKALKKGKVVVTAKAGSKQVKITVTIK